MFDPATASTSALHPDAPLGRARGSKGWDDPTTLQHAHVDTDLGVLRVGATDRGLARVEFEEPSGPRSPTEDPVSEPLASWLAALRDRVEGRAGPSTPPLDLRGTPFQVEVWRFLQTIPAGTVVTYAELAARIGRPSAVRAAASACAANRVAVLVPCHRVVRGDGGLGGFRWGVERKRALLDRERGTRGRPDHEDGAHDGASAADGGQGTLRGLFSSL